jgi:hypothetical protein
MIHLERMSKIQVNAVHNPQRTANLGSDWLHLSHRVPALGVQYVAPLGYFEHLREAPK